MSEWNREFIFVDIKSNSRNEDNIVIITLYPLIFLPKYTTLKNMLC